MRRLFSGKIVLVLGLVVSLGSGTAVSQVSDEISPPPVRQSPRYVPGELLVKFKAGVSAETKERFHSAAGARKKRDISRIGVQHLTLPPHMTVEQAVEFYMSDPGLVEYAEPNYLRRAAVVPNDTSFGQLWGLHNTGQVVDGAAGAVDADIDAPEAWDVTTGSSAVVIAVIDSGVAWEHPDLTANIWTNPGEIAGNSLDDDGNGFVDDVRGWDFVDGDNDPTAHDNPGHGTHVAGTIAAVGNNAAGITGVMQVASIMPLRFLDTLGSGGVADEIEAINYAIDNGAVIINASYGSPSFSSSEQAAIAAAGAAGILFVAAAGNDGTSNDSSPNYPSNYTLDNVISVAATTQTDGLASFSNFGATSVDLGAPGTNTYSTIPARQTIFSDDFEGGLGNWTTDGAWGLTTPISASPTHSLADSPAGNYANSTDSSARLTAAADLTGEQGCRLDYELRLATQSNADFLRVERSTDAAAWTLLNGPGGYSGSTVGQFFEFTEDMTPVSGLPSVFVRFRLLTNASVVGDGAYTDDVDLNCATSIYTGTEFDFLQGTSMATPHTTGVAGLVASLGPLFTPSDIKRAILNSVDPESSLSGKVLTGGRLNANGAVLYATGADLEVTQSASPSPVARGNDLTFTIAVTNFGLQDVVNATVVDTLPGTVDFVSATPSQGSCSASGIMVDCDLGALAKGAGATVAITVTTTTAGTLTNGTVVVGSGIDPVDPNLANNTATVSVTVRSPSGGGGCGRIAPVHTNGPGGPAGMAAALFLLALFSPLLMIPARRRLKEISRRVG